MKQRVIILILLLLTTFPLTVQTFAQEEQDNPVMVISNLTSISFTVSWFSREKADQTLFYGKTEPLAQFAVDDRGGTAPRFTHHVTLHNLDPDTEYLFRIGSDGVLHRQRTAPRITGVLPPLPERFKGTIKTEEDTIPEESILYLKVAGAGLQSTTSNQTGEWALRTANMRTLNLSAYYKLQEIDTVDLFARAGFEGDRARKVYAFARENPIEMKLTEPRIPFFKLNIPGEAQFVAQVAQTEQSSEAQTGIQPANDEGFFQIIWKRVREIF